MDGIQLTPVNGAGPNCHIFGGSGGRGIYQYEDNGNEVRVELSDIGWQVAPLLIPLTDGAVENYLIAINGTYTHDGMSRPFVGHVDATTSECFSPSDGAFSWSVASLTLL